MTEVQMLNQLKFRISSLQTQLVDKNKQLDQYRSIESQADNKIQALNKMHSEKIKSLLNSIQILKKQKASIEGLTKQHKRSKLIQQLNKEIADQDLAIEVLRKYVYDQKGKQIGRAICDQIIIKALTKGPQRIRPLSRQQLRIEIDKLKVINLNLQGKLKISGPKQGKKDNDAISDVSSVSEQSFVNHNETILNKLKELQYENQNMKLDVNSKLKIIQKLKNQLKQKDKLKAEVQLLNNQIQISNRKVQTYEKLMKQSKQHTNAKIIELYQREIKVEQLEMVSKQNGDKIKQMKQGHGIMIEEIKLEKQKVQAELQALKKENQRLIMDTISNKNRQDQQKRKIQQIRELSTQQKDQLKQKLEFYQKEVTRIVEENKFHQDQKRKIKAELFNQRAKWVNQKHQMLEQLDKLRAHKGQNELVNKYQQDIDKLSKQNQKLNDIIYQGGTGGSGDNHILLQRLKGYEQRLKFLTKSKDNKQADYFNNLFEKYNELAKEFQQYKQKYGPKEKKKTHAKQYIEIDKQQQQKYNDMSSGISQLNLQDVDSAILDNMNSSYQYQLVVNEDGKKVKMPKMTQADRELLKLINSDLWGQLQQQQFVLSKKLDEAASLCESEDFYEQNEDMKIKVRQLKNLNHPRGKKILLYEQQVNRLDDQNDDVSITSALEKELQKYDSDIDIEFKKINYAIPDNLKLKDLKNVSLSSGSSVSVKSIDSTFNKKKNKQKGTTIGLKKLEHISSDIESKKQSMMVDSDVSSVGISESQLAKVDSDIEHDFKRKVKK